MIVPKIKILLSKFWRRKLLYAAIFACIIPIIVYVYRFHNCGFSKDPADWGTFGDYIGGVYSVLLSVIAIYVTYMISEREDKSREKRRAITELYKRITSIKSENVDLIEVNKIVQFAEKNQLILPKALFAEIVRYTDYLKEIYGKPTKMKLEIEKKIKDELITYISE